MRNSRTISQWTKAGAALLVLGLAVLALQAHAAEAPDIAKPVVSVVAGGLTVISQPLASEQAGIAIAVKHTGSAFETPYDGSGIAQAAFSRANAQLRARLSAALPMTAVSDGVAGRDFWMFEISGRQADWKALLQTAFKTLASPDFGTGEATPPPCDAGSPDNLYYLNAYRTSPLRFPTCGLAPGNPSDPNAMKDYYSRHFVPPNLVIAVAGNVTHQDLLDFLSSEETSAVSDSAPPPRVGRGTLAEPAFQGPRQFVVSAGGSECFWTGGFRLDGEGAAPAPFFILRELLAARIRDDFGRYGFQDQNLDISLDEYEGAAPTFRLTLRCDDTEKAAALQLVSHAIEQLQGGGMSEGELEAARNRAQRRLREPFVFPANGAPVLAGDYIVSGNAGRTVELIQELLSVSGREVQAAAQALSREQLTVVETATATLLAQIPPPTKNLLLRRQLNNGMRIALEKQPAAGLVEIRLSAVGGLRAEPKGDEGISALSAEALFAGTPNVAAGKVRQKLDALGADWGAFVEEEVSGVRIRVPAENAPDALAFLAEMVQDSTVPTTQMSALQSAAAADLQAYSRHLARLWGDRPAGRDLPDYALMSLLLSGGPSTLSLSDLRGHLGSIPREDILLYIRQHFTPPNLVLAAAGDLDLDATGPAIDTLFGKMSGLEARFAPVPAANSAVWTVDAPSSNRAGVASVYPAIPYRHKDRLALEVLLDLWRMKIADVWSALVKPSAGTPAPVFSAGAYFGSDTGFVVLYDRENPPAARVKPEEVLKASLLEITGAGKLDPASVNRAKEFAISSYLMNSADLTFSTRLLTQDLLYGTDDATLYRRRLEAVTLDDVKRVAASYFGQPGATVFLIGSAPKP